MKPLKLGSLFDGSGGFPLAGALFDVEPVWASEIEPFPIMVTSKRIPNMKHLGDIRNIHGDQIEPVDIITFGSPCQDISLAGTRIGIKDGERSNLFFEAIRIIKEMRKISANEYPRFAVFENVTGIFNSNGGQDFLAVLQSFVSICDENVSIPQPPDGIWEPSGSILGDNYSIAWRVLDSQYFGVPQRRKRLYLVASFRTQCSAEILFGEEGVQWDSEESKRAKQNASKYIIGCPDGSDWFRWMEE